MTTSVVATTAATIVFTFGMVCAGLTDLTTRKIWNRVVLLLLLAYGVLAPLAGFAVYEIGWSAVVALVVLLFAFMFFALGWIGGGDAKLAAVTALWFGADHTLAYLVCTALLGGAFAAAIVLFQSLSLPIWLQNKQWIARLHSRGTAMPYGVAMAAAALVVFPATPWMTPLM